MRAAPGGMLWLTLTGQNASIRKSTMLTRTLAIPLLLTAALASCSSSSSSTAVDSTNSSSAATTSTAAVTTTTSPRAKVSAMGTYAVGRIEVTYVDSSRKTDANNDFKGAPTRTIHTNIWYPAVGTPTDGAVDNAAPDVEHGRYPMILFSHGNTALAAVYGANTVAWASAGYVVVGPDYPLSNRDAPGGPKATDLVNQPADAKFIIDKVLADDDAKLKGIIDAQHIGATGHSLGAMTSLGLAYTKCCTDPRIKAVIPMAGARWLVDKDENYFTGTPVPLLLMHGDADGTVPYSASVSAYKDAKAPKMFITIPGGSHYGPFIGLGDPLNDATREITTAFFDRWLKDDVNALDRVRTQVKNTLGAMTLQEQLR